MASKISAGTTSTTALVYTADTSGVLQLQTNGTTTAVTIDTSQNVGIGTSSPSAKLDVVGVARVSGVSGTGYQGFRLFGTGIAYNYMQIDNTGGVINFGVDASSGGALLSGSTAYATVLSSYSNTPIQFGTNNTLRMTLDNSGNLQLGTTTNNGRLTVAGVNNSNTNYGLYVTDSSGNLILGTRNDSYVRSPATYNATSASAANITMDSSGFFYRSTSALKYKQDIRDLEQIDISKFRPVRYKSKCINDDQTIDHFGIIADEVEQVGIKELVLYGANGEVEGFQYERMVVVLTKALQELSAQVTTLQSQVAALTPKA